MEGNAIMNDQVSQQALQIRNNNLVVTIDRRFMFFLLQLAIIRTPVLEFGYWQCLIR